MCYCCVHKPHNETRCSPFLNECQVMCPTKWINIPWNNVRSIIPMWELRMSNGNWMNKDAVQGVLLLSCIGSWMCHILVSVLYKSTTAWITLNLRVLLRCLGATRGIFSVPSEVERIN
jgi:hypothetical protein